MAIKTKSRKVVFTELTPGLAHILYKLQQFHFLGLIPQPDDLVITSMNDGEHSENSRHYSNEALDLRTHNFESMEQKKVFRQSFEQYLGPKFRVLHESIGTPNEHFHIQVRKGMRFP